MEKLKEENGEKKEAGEGAAVQPPQTPVGGKVRDIKKMVSFICVSFFFSFFHNLASFFVQII